MNKDDLILKFENIIETLKNKYQAVSDDYFFTEKELHSFFYHLCLLDGSFTHKGYNLIHAEYPSPFKCSFENKDSNIIREIASKYMRAHIDLVLINPNFIDWIKNISPEYNPVDYIKGIRNNEFSTYIKKFIEMYEQFYVETGESVLLYALEFKYFRNTFEGIKNSQILVRQDINKLRNLKRFKLSFMKNDLFFSNKIKLLVFVGEKIEKPLFRSTEDIHKEEAEVLDIIKRQSKVVVSSNN